MKAFTAITIGSLFVCTLAFANDVKNEAKETVDHSKNPITGTETTTKEFTKEVKTARGSKGQLKIKEKTKKYKDGTVKTTTEADSETTEK